MYLFSFKRYTLRAIKSRLKKTSITSEADKQIYFLVPEASPVLSVISAKRFHQGTPAKSRLKS